jgi:hypothetical protein
MFKFKIACTLICMLAAFAALAGPVRAEWESISKPAKEQATAKALKSGEFIYEGAKVKCVASSLQVKWEFQSIVIDIFLNIEQPARTRGWDLKVKIGSSTSCTATIGTLKTEATDSACVIRAEQGVGEFKQLKGGYDTTCTIKAPPCEIQVPAGTNLASANSGLLGSEATNNGSNVIATTNFKGITATSKGALCPLALKTKAAELREFEEEGLEAHAS